MTDKLSAELLIKEHLELKDWIADANKRFGEFLAPKKARLEQIDALLMETLNELTTGDKKSVSTDYGVAYVSNLLNVSIDPESEYYDTAGTRHIGTAAFREWCLDLWDEYGSDAMLVTPQKDAVKRHLEDHGKPPPGLKISYFARVNVRRS